ncbi:hypothetical protein [Devosia sp.]|uniref:hypothetical protein n=1 Tax=Devosia sp. TaxID=1871048 RepID=UPI001AD512EA|nr:hypothetical protein [Devosia sp.]MBN9334399.1 hypothetical protein [Devosia sp.]
MTTAARPLTFLEPSLVYRLDAGISGSMGLCLFVLATPLATLVGWPPMQTILLGAGIFLLPWALFNWAIGAAGRADPISVTLNILGDGLWVLLSLALLVLHSAQMTPIGVTLIAAQALAVAAVFVTKLAGRRTLLA